MTVVPPAAIVPLVVAVSPPVPAARPAVPALPLIPPLATTPPLLFAPPELELLPQPTSPAAQRDIETRDSLARENLTLKSGAGAARKLTRLLRPKLSPGLTPDRSPTVALLTALGILAASRSGRRLAAWRTTGASHRTLKTPCAIDRSSGTHPNLAVVAPARARIQNVLVRSSTVPGFRLHPIGGAFDIKTHDFHPCRHLHPEQLWRSCPGKRGCFPP